MRIGGRVFCVRGGKAAECVITRLAGNGPSGYKLLDLRCGDEVVERVPHKGDADGGAFWDFEAPARKRTKKAK